MKVLMFSTDKTIFESGSQAQERMVAYGQLAERLFIVVLSKKLVKDQVLDISHNVKVYARSFWGAWRLGKLFRNDNISLITAQDPFETGLIGYWAVRDLKAKLQLQIHTDFLSQYFIKESLKNRFRVLLAKWLLPKANSVRVVSERIRSSLTAYGLQLMAITVLPIFVDVQKIQSAPITVDLHKKYPQFDFIILVASRLTKEKNIFLAIKATSEVIKINPKVGLIIVGDGPEESSLRLETRNSKLETNIIFEPWINDLPSYCKTADVFLNTSNYEGYGRTLIEAAAAGCPIITTDVGLVGDIINKDNSLIIPVGDVKKLVVSTLKLIEDSHWRNELGRKAKEAAQKLDNKKVYLENYKQSWQNA